MPLLHFHVDNHDVGYMPDPDGMSTHATIDGAVDDAITRAEDWIDQITMMDTPDEPTRGQPYATEPHTCGQEVLAVDNQIKEIQESLRTDEEFMDSVAKEGLLFVLENGVSVIELTPCAELHCLDYREEWID